MSKMKKILAVLLAAIMTLAMTVTAFATTDTDDKQVKVIGVENETGVTVTAYQIIKYNEAGYYEPVIADTITKDTNGNLTPTAADVQKLAKRIDELIPSKSLVKQTDGTYVSDTTDNLSAGTWMIIITGSKNYLYNPAIVSVQQGTDGLEYGELNLNTDSWGTDVYAKKSQPTIKKEAITPNVQGVQYGDIIQFKITADIPSYTENIDLQKYVITDTLTGLALVVDDAHPFSAKLEGEDTSVPVADGTIANGATQFKIDLASTEEGKKFVKANTNKKIVITYYAKVTTDAKITVDEANNTAKLEYSTNDDSQEKTDITRHYTFGIDTTFSGKTSEKTNEFIKINDKGDVKFSEGQVVFDQGVTPLSGAEFKLYTSNPDKNPNAIVIGTYTTDNDGYLEINGLDSDVTYYLKETKAPTGYTINPAIIPVKIDATFDIDGTLNSYTVKIGDHETRYTYNAETKETTKPEVQNPYGFKNSKLVNLPSTGGIGTTIFTVAGSLIMIFAVALLFASRRRISK